MNKRDRVRDFLLVPVATAVLFGWAASLVFGLLTANFIPLTATSPLMLVLAGYVFGVNLVQRKDNGNGN